VTPVSFWVWLEKMVEEESRRLHLNEMQLPLPPALFEGLDLDCVRFYPPEELEEQLRLQIADYAGVDPSFVLFILALMVSSSSCTRCFGTELFSYMILLTTSMSMKH